MPRTLELLADLHLGRKWIHLPKAPAPGRFEVPAGRAIAAEAGVERGGNLSESQESFSTP
jgi:hypothetical protein